MAAAFMASRRGRKIGPDGRVEPLFSWGLSQPMFYMVCGVMIETAVIGWGVYEEIANSNPNVLIGAAILFLPVGCCLLQWCLGKGVFERRGRQLSFSAFADDDLPQNSLGSRNIQHDPEKGLELKNLESDKKERSTNDLL